ncbi:MAG: oxidoreductase [bacterium]|nr:oxidoreductase [bacterium]
MRVVVAQLTAILILGCASDPIREIAASERWLPVQIASEASLRAVFVVDANTAWASGSGGTVVGTTDGGTTWFAGTISGAETLDFRDVHAWDADRALVISAGLPAKVFLTENAGASWREVYTNETKGIFFNSMAFWNEDRGIAVGDPIDGRFMLIETRDGGATWVEIPFDSRPMALEGEANFAASGTCLAVQGEGRVWFGTGGVVARVFRSGDWGHSWQASKTPLRSEEASQGIYSVLFHDESNGIVVGGDWLNEPDGTANSAFSQDGGQTWLLVEPGPPGFRECVVPMGENSGQLMTVGPTGVDITDDSGLTWRPVSSTGRIHAAAFSNDGTLGVAVGAEGLVAVWSGGERGTR